MNLATPRTHRASVPSGKGIKVEKSVTIDRPREEVYAFWRRLENLPRFMNHLESVTETDKGISHWVIKSSGGKRVQWDAQLLEERPYELISWQSLPGADVENAGSVWFTAAPGERGTIVKLALKYALPGGKLASTLSKLFSRSAAIDIQLDLLRLKKLMEGAPAEVSRR